MWKVNIEITISSDDDTKEEKKIQVQIEESIPNGFQNLDKWEQCVRNVGFKSMRELFKNGIGLHEEKVLSEYTHCKEIKNDKHCYDKSCHMVRCGQREFTLKTAFGEVRFPRQRMFCKTCGKWLIPLNDALGLHDDENEKSTIGFKELSGLCSVNQPYRLAADMIRQVTQDPDIVSHEHVRQLVQEEGRLVRQMEEENRKDAVFCFIKSLQNNPSGYHPYSGRMYICLDGVFVRSNSGKDRFHEGKVGFICTDARESAGNRLRILNKRYVSSFEDSYVFGGRLRGEALRLAIRLYKEVFIIGDGARWIREIREQCFPGTIYILDWYHLKEKLYRALRITLPDTSMKDTYTKFSTYLWMGLKENALNELKLLYNQLITEGKQSLLSQHEGLEELIGYIESNWEGIVDYHRLSQSGYVISSCLVEKAVDLVVSKRQKKSQGMHWSQIGADNICALRTLWLNGDWKGYWWERREKAA